MAMGLFSREKDTCEVRRAAVLGDTPGSIGCGAVDPDTSGDVLAGTVARADGGVAMRAGEGVEVGVSCRTMCNSAPSTGRAEIAANGAAA